MKENAVIRSPMGRAAALFTLVAPLVLCQPAFADWDRFGGSASVDYTNAYFYRGILQERDGGITQPGLEFTYNFYSSDEGPIRDFTAFVGGWGSFHSERTGADHSPSWWYEMDYYGGFTVGFDHGVSFTTGYTILQSPSDAFPTSQELNYTLAWDDSEVFGRFAVQPSVNFIIETVNTLLGDDEGVGVEIGFEPTIWAAENESFTLTMPATVGLNLSKYYESASGGENTFGYGKIGLAADVPLSFMPESLGAWSFGLGADYYTFSTTLEKTNSDLSGYFVATASLGVSF
jgi:hypothetical protein